MISPARILPIAAALGLASVTASAALANDLREKGKVVEVAKSGLVVTPPRDWNKLTIKPGKLNEVWTLDGEQLNDVTFYGGIPVGEPLVRERDRKRAPLPRFTANTLLIETPELLENTYRAYKQIGTFQVTSSQPERFLGQDGVSFTYEYVDKDQLPRKGEARAAIVRKRLYMVTYDAPRLHFFSKNLSDFRGLVDATSLR